VLELFSGDFGVYLLNNQSAQTICRSIYLPSIRSKTKPSCSLQPIYPRRSLACWCKSKNWGLTRVRTGVAGRRDFEVIKIRSDLMRVRHAWEARQSQDDVPPLHYNLVVVRRCCWASGLKRYSQPQLNLWRFQAVSNIYPGYWTSVCSCSAWAFTVLPLEHSLIARWERIV